MLHVFSVTGGHMMTFDITLATKRVVELKQVVSKVITSDPGKQVMLINGGQALEDDEKVHVYSAGTETNPIYVFDKSAIENLSLPETSPLQIPPEFDDEIKEAIELPASYSTVVARTKLAIRINEATTQQLSNIKLLVKDEHLMFQGWQAATSNLSDVVRGLEQKTCNIYQQCRAVLEDMEKQPDVLEGLEGVVENLRCIPLLPCLEHGGAIVPNLLEWIELKCQETQLPVLIGQCTQRSQMLTSERLELLCRECAKVIEETRNMRMIEITGIEQRLSALDHVTMATERDAREQRDIAQGFLKNQERARELQECSGSRDALVTFCESHVTQLGLMRAKVSGTRRAVLQCYETKKDLASKLHKRLRWLYLMQRSILNADIKLSMFRDQLTKLGCEVEFLAQVKKSPDVYFTFLVECVRRKRFSDAFREWTNKVLTSSKVARDKELTLRKKFKASVGSHFIRQLFPGFSDRPPALAKRPLPPFDGQLPDVTPDQVKSLQSRFPDFDAFNGIQLDSYKLTSNDPFPWQLASTEVQSTLTSSPDVALQTQTSSVTSNTVSITSSSASVSSFNASVGMQPVSMTSLQTSAAMSPASELEPSRPLHKVNDPQNIRNDDSQSSVSNDPKYPLENRPTFTPGGFVVTSVQKLVNGGSSSLEDFSCPTLSTPGPESMEGLGSPDSEQFYSLMSYPLGGAPQGSEGRTISVEENLAEDLSGKQSPVTMFDSNQEDIFHSLSNDADKHKLLQKLQTLQEEKQVQADEFRNCIKKLEAKVSSLESSRDVVVADFDRRWAESRKELEYVIGQLESEERERKLAWEKESRLNVDNQELKSKCSALEGAMKKLKTDLSTKIHLLHEFEFNSKREKDSIQLEVTQTQAEAERQVWEAKQAAAVECATMTKTIEALNRELELKAGQLNEADDRVQELESELSGFDARIAELGSRLQEKDRELEGARERASECRSSQENAESRLVTLQNLSEELRQKLERSEKQGEDLKTMMGDYEVELNESRDAKEALAQTRALLDQERAKVDQLESERDSARSEVQKFANDVEELSRTLRHERAALAELRQSLEGEREQARLERGKVIQEAKDSESALRSQLQEAQERKLEEAERRHDQEVETLEKKWGLVVEETNANNRSEQDELRADHLAEIMSLQQKISEMQEESKTLNENHVIELKRVEEERSNEVKRLTTELQQLSSQNAALQEQLVMSRRVNNTLMTSSMMSLSSEELETKRTKMDNSVSDLGNQATVSMSTSMMISMHDHQMSLESMRKELSAQKEALESSFKKKEEDSTKRRQLVFNTAIQQVKANKEAEIEELKRKLNHLMQSSSVSSSAIAFQESENLSSPEQGKDKVSVANFRPDDLVLVTYDPDHAAYVMVALGHTKHFINSDSLQGLGLTLPGNAEAAKVYTLAKFVHKDYCQARKSSNRFKVPVGRKFYHVRVKNQQKTS